MQPIACIHKTAGSCPHGNGTGMLFSQVPVFCVYDMLDRKQDRTIQEMEDCMNKINCEGLKEIIFYARKVIAVPSGNQENRNVAVAALRNLSDYGFILDKAGVDRLCTADRKDIEKWYYKTAEKFAEMAGANHEYRPFYPNFPEEVLELSDAELLYNQVIHYITVAIGDVMGCTEAGWMPEEENEKEWIKSLEEHPPKVIQTIDENDEDAILEMAADIFQNTLKTKLTPSAGDMSEIINAFLNAAENWAEYVRTVENRLLLSYLYTRAVLSGQDTKGMPELVVNDYLRILQCYSYMHKNGISEMKSFDAMNCTDRNGRVIPYRVYQISRPMRRFVADGLEALGKQKLEDDIPKNPSQWKSVFKAMYAGTMKDHPALHETVCRLRGGEKFNTYYARLQKAIDEEKYMSVLHMYASRPGEFVKNVGRLLSFSFSDKKKGAEYAEALVKAAGEVFDKTRPEDLIRLIGYLRSRRREDRIPCHNIKGRLYTTNKKQDTLPETAVDLFISIAKGSIAKQIYTGKPYGKVYIDSMLEKFPLPTEVSDTSMALQAYPRGSRIPLERNEDGSPKNVRIFIWWTNTPDKGRVDIDLSANLYCAKQDGTLIFEESVSYCCGFRSKGIVHSGDITDGGSPSGKGAAEYIDIDFKELHKRGIRYVQVYVNCYSGQQFGDIPHLGGWQVREELDKSKQFDVKAVQQTSTINGRTRGCSMAVADIKNAEMIWLDSPDAKAVACSNCLDAVQGMDGVLSRYAKGDQVTMKEMAELAVAANGGEITDSMEEADTIFCVSAPETASENQTVITAKDQDIWLGRFMTPQTPEEEDTEKEGSSEEDAAFSAADIISWSLDKK